MAAKSGPLSLCIASRAATAPLESHHLREDEMENTPDQGPHAAERDETLESGLRMIARLIARAHLRRQGALASDGASDDSGGTSPLRREREGAQGRPPSSSDRSPQ